MLNLVKINKSLVMSIEAEGGQINLNVMTSQQTLKEDLLERMYFTRSMSLHIADH